MAQAVIMPKFGQTVEEATIVKWHQKEGDQVSKGTVVGTVGMTGVTSGPHVHVGYGVRAPGIDGVKFGNRHYKVTDPKLFFYREHYLAGTQ